MSDTDGDWHPTACVLCSVNCGLEVRLDGRSITHHKHVPARLEKVAT